MKLLVTGGAGFIGANFIYYYQEAHPEDCVVCLDALTYAGSLANVAGLTAIMIAVCEVLVARHQAGKGK